MSIEWCRWRAQIVDTTIGHRHKTPFTGSCDPSRAGIEPRGFLRCASARIRAEDAAIPASRARASIAPRGAVSARAMSVQESCIGLAMDDEGCLTLDTIEEQVALCVTGDIGSKSGQCRDRR